VIDGEVPSATTKGFKIEIRKAPKLSHQFKKEQNKFTHFMEM